MDPYLENAIAVTVHDVITDVADDKWRWLREDIEYLLMLIGAPDASAALAAFARPVANQARNPTNHRLFPHDMAPFSDTI